MYEAIQHKADLSFEGSVAGLLVPALLMQACSYFCQNVLQHTLIGTQTGNHLQAQIFPFELPATRVSVQKQKLRSVFYARLWEGLLLSSSRGCTNFTQCGGAINILFPGINLAKMFTSHADLIRQSSLLVPGVLGGEYYLKHWSIYLSALQAFKHARGRSIA